MQKITQIDLLVHPFFEYCPEWLPDYNEETYGEIEAGIMLDVWKRSVDEMCEEGSRRMVFLSNTTRQKFFDDLMAGRLNDQMEKYISKDMMSTEQQLKEKFKKETELVKYADKKLGKRALFLHGTITGNQEAVKKFISGASIDETRFRLNIYGELLTACVMDETKKLAACLQIKLKKEHVRFKPKKSVDWVRFEIAGYPRIWKLKEIENLRRKGTITKKERDLRIKWGQYRYKEQRKQFFEELLNDK